jgi:hypothetical protein
LPADLPRPENDSSPPRSPAEKQALLREVKRLTHGTRKCKHRLPDNMPPGFMTWEYIDAWRKALQHSRPPSTLVIPEGWPTPPLCSVPNQSAWDHSSSDTAMDRSSEDSEGVESRELDESLNDTESEDPDSDPDGPPPYEQACDSRQGMLHI